MFRQWFSIFWFFILVSSTRLLAQVGAPGSFEKYEFQPEAFALPTYGTGTVSEHGDYQTSIPIGSVTSPSGISFSFSLSYNSNIRYEDVAGWLGLGWSAGVGTINRSVRGSYEPIILNGNIELGTDFSKSNPVDFPSNVRDGFWDGNKDIYFVTLPNGTSLECIRKDISSNSWDEFEALNDYGYTIKAQIGGVTVTDSEGNSLSIDQSANYGINGRDHSGNLTDYTAFLVEAPDGIRYLYKKPSLELNEGPVGNQALYVSTWRIVAIVSPYYSPNPWSAENNEEPENKIRFFYSQEFINWDLKTKAARQPGYMLAGRGEYMEYCSHSMYLQSVESVNEKMEVTYIQDLDTDRTSKFMIENKTQGEGQVSSPPKPVYTLTPNTDRRRISGIQHYRKAGSLWSPLKNQTFTYETAYNRSFLASITIPELENEYRFSYNQLHENSFADFDYSLIWDYHSSSGGDLEINFFDEEYHSTAKPWDINGYFKIRNATDENSLEYDQNCFPSVGQLNQIIYPTGRVESIYYGKKGVLDRWDIQGALSNYPLRSLYFSRKGWNGTEFTELDFPYSAVYSPKEYFNGIEQFYKSCPDSIIITDSSSPKKTRYEFSIQMAHFPGYVKEMNFNNLYKIKRASSINPPGYFIDGTPISDISQYSFREYFATHANYAMPDQVFHGLPEGKMFRLMDDYTDGRTGISYHKNEVIRFAGNFPIIADRWEKMVPQYLEPVEAYLRTIPGCKSLIASKASRVMDIEDRVWFGRISMVTNDNQFEIRETQVQDQQPIGLMLYELPGNEFQLVLSASNWHEVNIQESISKGATDETLFIREITKKLDPYGGKVQMGPTIFPQTGDFGSEDYTCRWKFRKQPAWTTSIGLTTSKTLTHYDENGNLVIKAQVTGKFNDDYLLTVTYNRYARHQVELQAPSLFKNTVVQEISGTYLVDSLIFADSELLWKHIGDLGRNFEKAMASVSGIDSARYRVDRDFKLLSNKVYKYKVFEGNIYALSEVYVSKEWPAYRFGAWGASQTPDASKWQRLYAIEEYSAFGAPLKVNYGRFTEEYFFGSSASRFNTDPSQIYWYKPTARRITSSQFTRQTYSFSASYNSKGLIEEASLPNAIQYKFGYDIHNRLVKTWRNNTLIKRTDFNLQRLNNFLRVSEVNFISTADSLIKNEFFDGFGMVQTQTGHPGALLVSEPVFDQDWNPAGNTLPFKLTTGQTGFQNPFNRAFLSVVSNGGNLNFDQFNEFNSNTGEYKYTYSNSRKQNSLIGAGNTYPFVTSEATSLGSVSQTQTSGAALREMKKSKRTYSGGLLGDYLASFAMDEDGKVQFAIKEADGRVLFEGKASINNFADRPGELSVEKLLNRRVSIKSAEQSVETNPPPASGGTSGGGIGVAPLTPPCNIVDYEKVRLIKCEERAIYYPTAKAPGAETNIMVFSDQFTAGPLDYVKIPITNLPEDKTLKLRKLSASSFEWEVIQTFRGPVTADTLVLFPLIPGSTYRFDFFEDLGCRLGDPCPEPAKFIRASLAELEVLSVTAYQYNDLNQLVAVVHPDGSSTQYQYDFFGRVIRKETPYHSAKKKNLAVDENHVSENPDFEYLYDQYGQLRFSIDPNQSQSGKMTVNVYDGIGRVIETGEMNSAGRFTEANATSFMYPFTAVVNNGTAVLDPADRGNMTTPADYAWQQQIFYDLDDSSQGRISQTMDRIEKPDGTMGTYTKSIQYRKPGWVAKVTTVYTDGLVQTEEFLKHDNLGKPAEMVVKLNNILYRKTWMEYTPFGQPYRVFHSRNTTKPALPHFTYEWDAAGRQVSKVINPINSRVVTTYTPENWLSSINFAQNGSSSSILDIRYNYFDPSMLSGQTVKPSYAGQITQMKTKYGDETTEQVDAFFYDDLNRLISSDSDVKSANGSVTQNPFSTSYRYDIMGNILQTRRNWMDPGVNQVREKDNFQYQYAGNRLLNLVDLSPVTTSDSRNVVTVTNTILGSETMYNTTYPGVYDSFEQYAAGSSLPASQYQSSLPSSKVVLTTDGSNGRVLKVAPASASVAGKVTLDTLQVVGARTYTLKLRYRNDYAFNGEINEVKTKTSFSVKWLRVNLTEISEVLALDRVSSTNWINATKTLTAPAEAVFAIPVLSSFSATGASDGVFSWMDNVSMEETNRSYAYDSNGNTITDNIRGVTGMMYNRLNLPVQLTTQSQVIKYGYSWSGARLWKKTPASTTFYLRASDGSILGEYAGTVSSLKYLMLPGAGGTTEGQWEMNGTTFMAEYFYITDHLGNNRVSVKNNGGTPLVTGKTDYYPYGSVSREWTTSTENLRKFKYQQKERDQETGYDYFEARTYDSQIGRFLQVDPLWEKYRGDNPFVMASCNPIKFGDPTGKGPKDRIYYSNSFKGIPYAREEGIVNRRGNGPQGMKAMDCAEHIGRVLSRDGYKGYAGLSSQSLFDKLTSGEDFKKVDLAKESIKSGDIIAWAPSSQSTFGHAALVVGFDEVTQKVLISHHTNYSGVSGFELKEYKLSYFLKKGATFFTPKKDKEDVTDIEVEVEMEEIEVLADKPIDQPDKKEKDESKKDKPYSETLDN